jgi:hypothetical protein
MFSLNYSDNKIRINTILILLLFYDIMVCKNAKLKMKKEF